jgi:hypothetical protein
VVCEFIINITKGRLKIFVCKEAVGTKRKAIRTKKKKKMETEDVSERESKPMLFSVRENLDVSIY